MNYDLKAIMTLHLPRVNFVQLHSLNKTLMQMQYTEASSLGKFDHIYILNYQPNKSWILLNRLQNIANSCNQIQLRVHACFIFLFCTLVTSANKCLNKKIFLPHFKCYKTNMVHASAVPSSRYEPGAKFG